MRPRAGFTTFPIHFCSFFTFEKKPGWTDGRTDGDARTHLKMADTLVAMITKIRIKWCINMIDMTTFFGKMCQQTHFGVRYFRKVGALTHVALTPQSARIFFNC